MKANRFRFRAWNKRSRYMEDVDGYDLHIYNGELYEVHVSVWSYNDVVDKINVNEDYILMQSTGLTDKNGKEIFEGDIVHGGYGIPPIGITSTVLFENGVFKIRTTDHNPPEATIKEAIDHLGIEIIGNIYQDSHLLDNTE